MSSVTARRENETGSAGQRCSAGDADGRRDRVRSQMTFEEALTGWLPGQRWFAGKGAPIDRLAIVADTVLVEGDPSLRHLIVAVSQASGTDRYQLLAGLRTAIPDRLEHAVIGPAGDGAQPGQAWVAYDALHDPPLTRRLLEAMAGQETIGPLSFRRRAGRRHRHRARQPGAHVRAEQHQHDLWRGGHPQGVPAAAPRPQP